MRLIMEKTRRSFRNLFLMILLFISINDLKSFEMSMQKISQELSDDLEEFKIDELGVEYITELYATFKYTTTTINTGKTLTELAENLEKKIEDIFKNLSLIKSAIENVQIANSTSKIHSLVLQADQNENLSNNWDLCSYFYNISNHRHSKIESSFDHVFQLLKSIEMEDSIKKQYFISSNDLEKLSTSPFLKCNNINHISLWKQYMLRNIYLPRKIVLVLDHGGSLSKYHLLLVKLIAKEMVANLNENDKISVVAISNDWSAPQLTDECVTSNTVPLLDKNKYSPKFYKVNEARKNILFKFIDNLKKGTGATNHSLGISEALNIVTKNQEKNDNIMILYISRGLLSSLTESKAILEIIKKAYQNVNTNVVIHTCAVVDETRPLMIETQFLKDIAQQNFKKYNISNEMGIQGTMLVVNSSDVVGFAVAHFYKMYSKNLFNLKEMITLPEWDSKTEDLSITFSIGSYVRQQYGLIAIEVYFDKWIEDFTYFCNTQKHQYAFLIDLNGHVILHPSFLCPITVKQSIHYVDISYFELVPDINVLRKRLIKEYSGKHVTTLFGSLINYNWRRIGNWYVVCLVDRQLNELFNRPYQIDWPFNTTDNYNVKLLYHNSDKSLDTNSCGHLDQFSTFDAGSLYLSSSCFLSWNNFLEMNNNDLAEDYMAFLQDNREFIRNPGLKSEIKDEVAALAYILNYLRQQHLTSAKSKYIIRRYTATSNGVVEMFPGNILDNSVDPTKRIWFIQANEHKNKLILTPPYLDDGGSGYIVTLAYGTPHLVVALDLNYGYIFRMLLKRMPYCTMSNITCFIMDDRGYLIYHPNLIDPNGNGPVEKQHIVHKESLVANDILNNRLFIKKLLCNNYPGNTVQRYYRLNTSYAQVLSNAIYGESCINYIISLVPNTNIFIGLVNASCNIVVTFCPCSIVDRICFNCNRMEPKECECPCECPLEETKCTDENLLKNPMCSWYPEYNSIATTQTSEMKSCLPAICSLEQTHFDCLRITGCEWCRYDVDGGLLKNPFCASQPTCFNGVVGSITPYQGSLEDEEIPPSSLNLPVSFIILFILGIFVILCMFYIYHRSSTSPSITERLYLSSTQDNNLRMSDLNINENFHFHSVNNHRDQLLQDEKSESISPYCVSSGYKRITMTAESDHGYSTMTQHDESEHMSLAPVELDSLEDDFTSDATSVNIPTKNHHKKEFTVLNNVNNCIIVPVTVHRNKEAT